MDEVLPVANFTVIQSEDKCFVIYPDFVGGSKLYIKVNYGLFFSFLGYVLTTLLWMRLRRAAPLLRKRGDSSLTLISSFGAILVILDDWDDCMARLMGSFADP